MVAKDKIISAFSDEAGSRGYVRKLTDSIDHEVSLLCSLFIPEEHVDTVRQEFQAPYHKFCSAAPSGAKLHITDAIFPGQYSYS